MWGGAKMEGGCQVGGQGSEVGLETGGLKPGEP